MLLNYPNFNKLLELTLNIDQAAENEMLQIFDSTQSYMELIKNRSPTPPVALYYTKTSEVETNVYDEPVKELLIEQESRESTPEYKAVPVKSLINTFELGKFLIASDLNKTCLQ